MAKVSSEALEKYYLVEDSQMPNENTMVGPLKASSLEECAMLCERHNEMLAGSYYGDGAISTGYSYEHCNAFVFDRERQLCTLKSKRMGNFYPQQGDATPECAFGGSKKTHHARYVSGYRWNSLINEVNTAFPNMTSGMQYWKANPTWSTDNWGVTNNHCTQGSASINECRLPYCPESVLQGHGVSLKPVGYDVRPGAVISSKNITTGPFSFGNVSAAAVESFPVQNMQQCADAAARRSQGSSTGPYTGVNAWTFHPDYSIEQATDELISQRNDWPGTCSVGHVREPYYQTLTPSDNGAISGFGLTSLSREVQRFLFGEMK
jgi:hypothetical protein